MSDSRKLLAEFDMHVLLCKQIQGVGSGSSKTCPRPRSREIGSEDGQPPLGDGRKPMLQSGLADNASPARKWKP